MSDNNQNTPRFDAESGFSDEEKSEIRSYIDTLATQNRISPEGARFNRKSAKPGVFIPIIVNVAAVIGVVVAILLLRAVFEREEQGVRDQAVEYSSIEGRLIRELRDESQALILEKEREIETVRQQLRRLEQEQLELESDIGARIAAREQELREELEAELSTERARLIAEGLNNDEIDRLMRDFEQERTAFYEARLAEYRGELEVERLALQSEIDSLRSEYQSRLAALEDERREIVDEFREREENLRVQLEQRTRVLEIARVEATADLEAAQRELAELERRSANVESVQNQIIGQIEQIQNAIQTGENAVALERIEALTSFLGQDEILRLQTLARRREMDLFLLRQLRSLVESRLETAGDGDRSITQELRLIGQIRRLSAEAAGAPSAEAARRTFDLLLETLPEVSRAHREVVEQVRDTAVADVRRSDRETVETRTASAATLAAAGRYEDALDAYVVALESLPAVAPDSDRILRDVLRLGYALTDYVIDGERSSDIDEIARRAIVDVEAERAAFEAQIEGAVDAAVRTREAELQLAIANRDDRIGTLERQIAALNGDLTALGARTLDQPEGAIVIDETQFATLTEENERLAELTRSLTAERDTLATERDRLELQRDQLVDERARLRTRFAEYAEAQQRAIGSSDFVGLANARDAFFLSSELDLFMPGLSDLIDEYDQQYAAEQQTTGLSAFTVNEIVQELSADLSDTQRQLLLEDAIAGAEEDGDQTYLEFLNLLSGMIASVD